MKLISGKRMAAVAVALSLPMIALADVSDTKTLTSGTNLNLATAATAASGGDLSWSGSVLSFVGSAKGNVLPLGSGASTYGLLTQQLVQTFAGTFTSTPIAQGSIQAGTILGFQTNGGLIAKGLVTSNTGGALTLQFTTYGASAGPQGPTITAVQNNYSEIQAGFPNYAISPSTLFVVKGSGFTTNTTATLPDLSKGPLTQTLNGASLSATVGGTTVKPYIYYAIENQIAAVLPSNTPTGAGSITVSYNGQTSASFPITVVTASLGLGTFDGSGTGRLIATSPFTGALYTYTNSVAPGAVITLWGSGLGGDTLANSDSQYLPGNRPINTPLQIYFGGVQATSIGYAGVSGFPGVNQVNVTVPQNAPTGCNVAVVAVNNGITSNIATLPINAGGGVCADPAFGTTGSQLNGLGGQSTVKYGTVILTQDTGPNGAAGAQTTTNSAIASFASISGLNYGNQSGSVSIPGCIVSQTVGTGSIPTVTGLDAGTITLTGPNSVNATLQGNPFIAGFYSAQLAAGAITSAGGTYTFKGGGGSAVGPFTANVVFPNPLINWTNQAAATSVVRGNGLTFNWTGGAAGTYVIMSGGSAGTINGKTVSGSYTCYAPVAAQTFTVPAYILGTLPAGNGTTSLTNGTTFSSFTATGIDFGYAVGQVTFDVNTNYN